MLSASTDTLRCHDARRHPQRAHRLAHRRAVPRARRARAHRPGAAVRGAGRAARADRPRGVVARTVESASVAILDADAVLARIIPSGSLEQIIYRVDALHWIEERGVPVMNSPRAIERSVDKFYTTALLQEAGLPTPETVVCERAADAMAAVLAMGDVDHQADLRLDGPRHGARQRSRRRASASCEPLEQMRAVFYVQRAVDHGGRDVRVVRRRRPGGRRDRAAGAGGRVADQRVARRRARGRSSCRRRGSSWRVRAAAAVGADYAGVDLLPVARRRGLRARGQRHPRLAGAAAGDRASTSPARSSITWSTACARERAPVARRSGAARHDAARDTRHRRDVGIATPSDVAAAAQLACLLEAARRSRATCRRAAISPTCATRTSSPAPPRSARRWPAPARAPLGATIRLAVEATARWTRSNTNLGIVLLLAPLARAAVGWHRITGRIDLRATRVRRVLDATTVDDARDVYAAIRLAAPGGLGHVRRRRTSPTSRR